MAYYALTPELHVKGDKRLRSYATWGVVFILVVAIIAVIFVMIMRAYNH